MRQIKYPPITMRVSKRVATVAKAAETMSFYPPWAMLKSWGLTFGQDSLNVNHFNELAVVSPDPLPSQIFSTIAPIANYGDIKILNFILSNGAGFDQPSLVGILDWNERFAVAARPQVLAQRIGAASCADMEEMTELDVEKLLGFAEDIVAVPKTGEVLLIDPLDVCLPAFMRVAFPELPAQAS